MTIIYTVFIALLAVASLGLFLKGSQKKITYVERADYEAFLKQNVSKF
jgi:hypothetical protein